ncbi:sensor histidine kinase [Pseudidiomarina sp.]|uniref:sensor histidine kinase n=1 Tax=Pseudidiomarina sp. TaxID=2081707 RepID=UPI003A96DC99
MQYLTRREYFITLAGLAFLSASVTFVDWWQRGQAGVSEALLAGGIAILLLFWLPLSVALFSLKKLKLHKTLHALPIWLLCFYIGYRCWGFALSTIYPTMQLGWLDTLFMSLPWAVGTYVIYRAYITYKALQAERLLRKQAELNHLKQTLHPHFLFNSLNTLSAFIVEDPQKAEQLTQDLASVLRHSLDTDNQATISLKHELLVLQKWLNVEQVRLGDDLKVTINVDEQALNYQLPPFLLQPLVENSIKHARQLPIVIDINCKSNKSRLSIQVRDNGPGFPDALLDSQGHGALTGVGLATTLQRLRLLENATCQLSNDSGALIAIELETKHD